MSVNSIMRSIFKYQRSNKGSAAVEFSLLAVPFMLAVVATIELSLYFSTATIVEGAITEVTRMIRTGEIQQEDTLEEMEELFIDTVCAYAGFMTECAQYNYEVRKLENFSSDTTATLNEDGTFADPVFELDDITAGCVAMVRLTYFYKFITPLFGTLWSDYPNSQRLIMSTSVIKSEPYNFDTAENCDLGE